MKGFLVERLRSTTILNVNISENLHWAFNTTHPAKKFFLCQAFLAGDNFPHDTKETEISYHFNLILRSNYEEHPDHLQHFLRLTKKGFD